MGLALASSTSSRRRAWVKALSGASKAGNLFQMALGSGSNLSLRLGEAHLHLAPNRKEDRLLTRSLHLAAALPDRALGRSLLLAGLRLVSSSSSSSRVASSAVAPSNSLNRSRH